jgi:hypothetical protein
MVSLTSPLVDENNADCQAIKADPVGRALWEAVAGAHARLVSTQRAQPLARLGKIRDELARLRDRHGQVVRGIYYMLQAHEELAAGTALAAQLQRLRVRIFPDNLMATRRSNRELAGHGELLRARLTAGDFATLDQLVMAGGGTLADAINEWFAIAVAVRELEDERSHLNDKTGPTGAEVAAARAFWIRTVQTFIAALRLRGNLPAAIDTILCRIDRVVDKAGPRRARPPADGATSTDGDRDHTVANDTMDDTPGNGEQAGEVAARPAAAAAWRVPEPGDTALARDRAAPGSAIPYPERRQVLAEHS